MSSRWRKIPRNRAITGKEPDAQALLSRWAYDVEHVNRDKAPVARFPGDLDQSFLVNQLLHELIGRTRRDFKPCLNSWHGQDRSLEHEVNEVRHVSRPTSFKGPASVLITQIEEGV